MLLQVVCERLYFATSMLNLIRYVRESADPPFFLRSISTHTTVLFAIILTFIFTVYSTSPKIGSFSKMHELLAEAASRTPVKSTHRPYLRQILNPAFSGRWKRRWKLSDYALKERSDFRCD